MTIAIILAAASIAVFAIPALWVWRTWQDDLATDADHASD
jgi:membrane protein YdbS with pleckstrin-like domain